MRLRESLTEKGRQLVPVKTQTCSKHKHVLASDEGDLSDYFRHQKWKQQPQISLGTSGYVFPRGENRILIFRSHLRCLRFDLAAMTVVSSSIHLLVEYTLTTVFLD